MNMQKSSDFRNFAILFITTILAVVLYGQINYTVESFSVMDLHSYRKMALASPNISQGIYKPFAYRLLGPFLVGLLPIPDPMGFYALAVAFSICLVVQFYYLLRYTGLSATVSVVTALLFIFNKHLFGFTIWDYFQINDILSLNFMTVLLLSMWRNQWVLFGITLVLGAATKEVSMLAIPVVFAYLLERKELSTNWQKAVAATIPGLLVFFLIRFSIHATTGNSLLQAFLAYSNKLYSPVIILRLLVNSFLPVGFVPFIFFKHTVMFFKDKKYLLLYVSLVLFSTGFGTDNERLMAPAFIVFYMLIGYVIQYLNPKKTFLLFLTAAGVVSSLHHQFARWPLPNTNWTYFFSIGSTLAVTICMYLLKLRRLVQQRE
ncbi:MAG: hypothetical protein HQK58_09790 [Deltaproteobacteria bacterium]|nr:hypothetical protein [Deltaproteobacteria bacterium]